MQEHLLQHGGPPNTGAAGGCSSGAAVGSESEAEGAFLSLGSSSASKAKLPRFHLQAQCRLEMISASKLMASAMGVSIY